jgi:aspartate kinase
MVEVYKFGGASVATAANIKNVASIIANQSNASLVVIISAIGKTTNALEDVVNAFYEGNATKALSLFDEVKQLHIGIAKELIADDAKYASRLQTFFTEAEWLLHEKPVKSYDFYYDQLVCLGELLSTTIVSCYIDSLELKHTWLDIRDAFRTDNNYREANIDWDITQKLVTEQIKPLLQNNGKVIVQGFIGSTVDNESTTLGREGSDYTAAIIANMLDAKTQTIWKDVAGVMNADPKKFSDAVLMGELNYDEVIEMAFYGATIIHPKTIKPLQNKGIPLLVKCFLDTSLPGTEIHSKPIKELPPIIILKRSQVMVKLKSKDFSFITEGATNDIYDILTELKIKPNMSQNTAISMQLCFDDRADKIEAFALKAAAQFEVTTQKDLQLLTVRHYNKTIVGRYTDDKQIIMLQQSPDTFQCLYV